MPIDSVWTGYNPELEDRLFLQTGSYALPFTLKDYQVPSEIDPRLFIRHDDQGNMGSCGGHGNTNTAEYIWALPYGSFSNDRQFSRLFAYLEAQRFDRLLGRDSGSTISGGLKVAKEIGYLSESELPYRTPYPGNASTLITDAMRAKASPYKIRSHTWLTSYDELFKYLSSGAGAAFAGTLWNNSFHASNGILEQVSLNGGDGHAYCFAGYSTRKDSSGRNYIWRKNSHSNDNWTEVSPKVLDQLFRHNYTAIVGMSDLATPGPRKISWMQSRPLE